MKNYCYGCKKQHQDTNWKYTNADGEYIYLCHKWFAPTHYEWVPQRVKDERKIYAKDIIQPFREGEPSAEFARTYPKQSKLYFRNEKKAPREVWKDIK